MFEERSGTPKSDRVGNDRCLERIFKDETAPTEAVALLLYFYTYELLTGRHCLQHDAETDLHLTPSRLSRYLTWLTDHGYIRKMRTFEANEYHFMFYIELT